MMHTMRQDATTAAHETTGARMTLDPTGRLLGDIIIVTATCAFHSRRVRVAAIIATTTVRATSTTIAAIEDHRKSDSNKNRAKATEVTSAKPHSISRLPGESRSLDMA